MPENSYTRSEVIEKLISRKVYLKNLPSLRSSNFALFYSQRHDCYYRSNVLDSGRISGPYVLQPNEIDTFLASTQHDGYRDFFFASWETMHLLQLQLEDRIDQANAILETLKSQLSMSFWSSSLTFHIVWLPVVGWLAIKNSSEYDCGYYEFDMDSQRALEEVLNALLENPAAVPEVQLSGKALERCTDLRNRAQKNFAGDPQRGMFYFTDANNAFTYLQNGAPIHIQYVDYGVKEGLFNHPDFGVLDKRGLEKHMLDLVYSRFKDGVDYRVQSLLQQTPRKHQAFLMELLQKDVQILTLKAADFKRSKTYEYLDPEVIFDVENLHRWVKENAIYFCCGLFHQTNYSLTEDKEHLFSHTLQETYPFKEKLTEVFERKGLVEVIPKSTLKYVQPQNVSSLAPNDGDEDAVPHVTTSTMASKIRCETKGDLTVFSWSLTPDRLKSPQGFLEAEKAALVLHEVLTGIRLKRVGQEEDEESVHVTTYSFGSRKLVAKTQKDQDQEVTFWDYETLPDDVMLTLKSFYNVTEGLRLEVHAFVKQELQTKIANALEAL